MYLHTKYVANVEVSWLVGKFRQTRPLLVGTTGRGSLEVYARREELVALVRLRSTARTIAAVIY